MNTDSLNKKKHIALPHWFESLFQTTFLSKKSGVLVWLAAPISLLCLNISLSGLQGVFNIPYALFLVLSGAAFCLIFRRGGLLGSYLLLGLFSLFFLHHAPPYERLWYIGWLSSLALTLFILLLTLEHCQALFLHVISEKEGYQRQTEALAHQLQQVAMALEEKEREFATEIEKLKEEAKLRKIERAAELKRIELIQQEIHQLNAQKENFIADARDCRQLALDYLKQLEEKEQAYRATLSMYQPVEEALKESQKERAIMVEKLHQAQQGATDTAEQLARLQDDLDRTNHALQQQRERALHLQTANHTLTEELSVAHQKVDELKHHIEKKSQEWDQLNSFYHSEWIQTQENVLKWQSKNSTSRHSLEEQEQVHTTLFEAERRLSEFRKQFDEKTKILAETRQELFALEGTLLCAQKEHEFSIQRLNEESVKENGELAHDHHLHSRRQDEMEQVILALEELISHILSQ